MGFGRLGMPPQEKVAVLQTLEPQNILQVYQGLGGRVGKRENGSFLNRMDKLARQKILHLQIQAHTHLLEKLCILILCLKLKMLSYFYYYFFKKG